MTGQVLPLQQDREGTPCGHGGGGVCTKLVVQYTWMWASLDFPTGWTNLVKQLVNGGGLGEDVQKKKGGNPEAEFPPQICGPGLPPHVRIARRTLRVKVNYLRGGVQGCCHGHYIPHRKCPRPVCRLLHLVVVDGEGLLPRQGVNSGIGARLQGGELGQSLVGHGHKKRQKKALRAVRERNTGNWGKFVRN